MVAPRRRVALAPGLQNDSGADRARRRSRRVDAHRHHLQRHRPGRPHPRGRIVRPKRYSAQSHQVDAAHVFVRKGRAFRRRELFRHRRRRTSCFGGLISDRGAQTADVSGHPARPQLHRYLVGRSADVRHCSPSRRRYHHRGGSGDSRCFHAARLDGILASSDRGYSLRAAPQRSTAGTARQSTSRFNTYSKNSRPGSRRRKRPRSSGHPNRCRT